MKKSFLISLIFACAFLPLQAQVDKKLMKKAAAEVWGTELPAFDPKTEIPEDFAQGQSAVIIANLYDIKATMSEGLSLTKAMATGQAKYLPVTTVSIHRVMVKLLDQAAVEYYSDFDFGDKAKTSVLQYTFKENKNAFGARLHKPDGTVVDVDLSESFAESTGKKGDKEAYRKIAIPGLEVGDILEYFYYDWERTDEVPPSRITLPVNQKYRTINHQVHVAVDRYLTVEYRNINGAFPPKVTYDANNFLLDLEVEQVAANPDEDWTYSPRQLPYLEIQLKNSNQSMVGPSTKRRAGIYADLPASTYFNDAHNMMPLYTSSGPIYRRALSLAKDYVKANPQASRPQVADATWLALLYAAATEEEETAGPLRMATYMQDIMEKLKLDRGDIGMGIVQPRSDFALTDILSWDDPRYFVAVGDTTYYFGHFGALCPGEWSGEFQGEDAMVWLSPRAAMAKKPVQPTPIKLPATRASANTLKQQAEVVINADLSADVRRKVDASGEMKLEVPVPQGLEEYMQTVEEYLGIPTKDRYKKFKIDSVDIKKKRQDFAEEETEAVLGVKPQKVNSIKINNFGNLPGSPTAQYEIDCTIEALAEDLGDAISVNVGKLMGQPETILAHERDRVLDIWLPVPYQKVSSLTIITPEGYKPDPTSVEELAIKEANGAGVMTVSAQINEEGNVIITYVHRFKTSHLPVEQWPSFYSLIEAANTAISSSLLYKKAN